jgi:excisionase family DNA binding protein
VNKNFFTRSEAAEYAGISPHILRKLALAGASGGPPLIRIGYRTVRYQRQQLDEWLRQRGAQPALFEFEATK